MARSACGRQFSFQKEEITTKGSWSISGPGVAAEWTQGGESEFLSIAARADAPAGQITGRAIEIPVAGRYFLWVRYADYRGKKEEFGVRVRQGDKSVQQVFGGAPVIDELDPTKLRWDWAFGWSSAPLTLSKGAARLELFSTGPTQARRQVDCIALTTDANYRPTGREKPDFAAWQTLRGLAPSMPAAGATATFAQNKAERPVWMWNAGEPWTAQLTKPENERIEAAFGVDPPLLDAFIAAYKGKQPPVYSHPLSGPSLYISDYPLAFKTDSPYLQWLARHPEKKFAILLNYGQPKWPEGTTAADKQAAYANLQKLGDRFLGFIAGENIAYAYPDEKVLEPRLRAAKSRAEILAVLREAHTTATVAKFSDYFGQKISPATAWSKVISCPSVGMEAIVHALANWGEKRLGHESSGNNAVLAQHLAFLRGAARQFGTGMLDYQSMNLGDSATMFSREAYFYPASSRYVLDNQYDMWAGAGLNWFLKDYTLWHLSGVDAFYNEQGVDIFWKPGGSAAGDDFPVGLSPKGRVAEAMQRVALAHPRGTQYTPIAFLLDEAHGWAQGRYHAAAFDLDPSLNPSVLLPGKHEASIRGWMDTAYYPAPETQNEPATGVRQTYVNGVFGDIFDAIVSTPQKSAIVRSYPVVVAAGEVTLSADWGAALRAYLQNGGTLVVSADQFTGAGATTLGLPRWGQTREASSVTWKAGNQSFGSNVFRYRVATAVAGDKVLASAPDGTPLCIERAVGKGRLIALGVPLAIGLNERPTPLSGLVMRYISQSVMPVVVEGDVEWVVNKLDGGGWLVTILNNRGITKPQHGFLPTDFSQAQTVTIRTAFSAKPSAEWMAGEQIAWVMNGQVASAKITVPAGAVRMIEIRS